MDTKYKKFDRYSLIRLIAVILIIIFTAMGSYIPVKWMLTSDNEYTFERGVKQYFSSDSEYDNSKFENSLYDFTQDLRLVSGVYGDGSVESYNRFLKKVKLDNTEKYIKEYKEKYTNALLSKDIYDRIDALKTLIYSKTVTLRKIDSHSSHYINAQSIDFDREGADIVQIDDSIDYYDSSEPEFLAGIYKSSKDVIPDEILKKADSDEVVINLCRMYFSNNRYDGYYAVKFSDSSILTNIIGELMIEKSTALSYSNNYEKFKADANKTLKKLNENKLFNYAVLNANKVLCTNISGLNKLNKEQIESKFKTAEWYVCDCFSETDYNLGAFSNNISSAARSYTFYGSDEKSLKYTTYINADKNEAAALKAEYDQEGESAKAAMRAPLTVFIISVIAIIACFIVVICLSGKIYDSDEIKLGAFGKIPLLIKLALLTAIVTAAVCLTISCCDDMYVNIKLISTIISADAVLFILLLLELICYFVKNIRAHQMSHRFISVCLALFLNRKRQERKERIANEPAVYIDITKHLKKKFILGVVLENILFVLIAFISGEAEFVVFMFGLMVAYDFVALIYALSYAKHVMKIFAAIREIKGGNYSIRLNPSEMPKSLKRYAQDVNTLGDSVKEAVEKALKEQNTKTELITNVSHDLKTPLTSIINYVDLLSKCNISDPEALSYIEILGEKSAKLKKLIEDLIEATKAQTGNIASVLVPVSLNELVSQIAGEYDDELEEKGLINVLSLSEEQLTVSADSKLSHRVLDNLFNNVAKYAMPGTRVYINVFRDGNYGSVTVRNISAAQLNIPANELMSRFVRGDGSRSTSGNGLGLSIAENLCKAQGGRFGIEINGDMFTAKVDFLLYADSKPNEEYFYEQ